MDREKALVIFRIMRSAAPKDAAVAEFRSPFSVLISTILSQRTRDANTRIASRRLFSKMRTPQAIASAGTREVESLIKPCGFFRAKARAIKRASSELLLRFNGRVPCTPEGLLSLPGVGRKTANCVLCYGFGIPAVAVDVHVHRVSNRIGLAKTKTPEETEAALRALFPKRCWCGLNRTMVRFGQAVCLPRRPRCRVCPLKKPCAFKNKSLQ